MATKARRKPRRIQFRTWRDFREALYDYSAQPTQRRNQLVFRGHASSKWDLRTTLDRAYAFASDTERDRRVTDLLAEFRIQGIRLGFGANNLPTGEALELLARHHGLPSPLLDWSGSPYIAGFFAFDGALASKDRVAIWRLDCTRFDFDVRTIDIINDHELLQFNRRALQQRGLFTRVATIRQSTESMLGDALTVFELPSSERRVALADLDEMSINAANLFYDLDGAACTARARVKV